MVGNAVQGPILFKAHLHGGNRFPLLTGNPLHFLIDFVAGSVNGFLGGNLG